MAGITLTYVLGDKGINLAKDAKKQTEEATQKEQDDLGNLVNFIQENKPKDPQEERIDTATSYVGYYADMEGDGKVDGIIYADLAKGVTVTGSWGDGGGEFEIEAVTTGLKEYYVSNEGYTGNFYTEAKPVIAPVEGSSGKERFYIMALEDVQLEHPYSETLNQAYWYYNASGKMVDYDNYTSTDFGSGKVNTKKMIARWKKDNSEVTNANEIDYGEPNENDLWGQIDTYVAKGWYVPSKEEWSAFGSELGIGYPDFLTYGLSDWYWTSSQDSEKRAWGAVFDDGFALATMNSKAVGSRSYGSALGCEFLS